MDAADYSAYRDQARTRRNRSRRKNIAAELNYFDILFCETVICIIYAFLLIALRYINFDFYNSISDCISSYQSLAIEEIIKAATESLKNALL